jgi:hypothetical protein
MKCGMLLSDKLIAVGCKFALQKIVPIPVDT